MKYNADYLDVHYSFLTAFLIDADGDILDISYSRNNYEIEIQVVLISGSNLSAETKKKVQNCLPEFNISIKEINLSKKEFNECKGEWDPKYYKWLDNVLFSKAEVL